MNDPERIERRRRVVALIAALQKHDDERAEALIAELSGDADLRRVVGSLGVAASSMVETLSRATKRSVDELLAELEEKMTQAPTADEQAPAPDDERPIRAGDTGPEPRVDPPPPP